MPTAITATIPVWRKIFIRLVPEKKVLPSHREKMIKTAARIIYTINLELSSLCFLA